MRSYYKMIRRWDIIVILILILISLLPVAVFSYYQIENTDEHSILIASISVNNEVVEQITLTEHVGKEEFTVQSNNGEENIIEVIDEKIRIKGATCSDQVCVRTGFISNPGETIVCLPHKVLIKIETINGVSNDMIISS